MARAKQELGWMYCRKDHDPANVRSTDTKQFRIGNLRSLQSDTVLEWRQGKDSYTGRSVSLEDKELQLDHVVELHIVRDAFDAIHKHGMDFERKRVNLLKFTRDWVVNEEFNLNFTDKDINLIKFKAFSSFQQDYNTTGRRIDQGVFPYVVDEYYSRSQECRKRRFSRKISGNITREVKHSFDSIYSAFEIEQPLHDFMMEKLKETETAMRLV